MIHLGENRLTVAMVDFYLAVTQAEAPARTTALTEIDERVRRHLPRLPRVPGPPQVFLALRAHFWQGRIIQELGQLNDAQTVYEEVVVGDRVPRRTAGKPSTGSACQGVGPEAGEKTGLEDFFADVEQYYFQMLYQMSKKDYLEEIKEYRTTHKANSEKCFGYQALSLEYAKHCLEIGEQSPNQAQTAKRGHCGAA